MSDKWYISGPLGIGALEPAGKLDVQGDIRAGNSDLYFTKTDHEHSGIGNTTGYAAIENASNFDALMILGRAGTDKGRKVRLWDYLEVNGPLVVQGNIQAGNSDIYFTKTDHAHSGVGNTAGHAAIENASDLDALAILGRAGTDKGRKVRLWDYLEVNGPLVVQGNIQAGNSDIYFTKTDHAHSGIGNTAGYAAIENASDLDALAILGRAGTDKGRKVRLWDYLEVNGPLVVQGNIQAGNSDIYFTKTDHAHSGVGNTAGYAAIENASDLDALAILGRAGTDKGRKVRLWDYLEVIGPLAVQGDLIMGSGKTISSPGRLHISGNENLYLLNKGGVIVSRAGGGNGNLEIEGVLMTHAISHQQAREVLASKANGTAIAPSAGGGRESRVDFYYKYNNEVHVASIMGGRAPQ